MSKDSVYTSEQLADDIMRWDWRDSFREVNKKAIIEMFEVFGRQQAEYALNPQSRPGFIGSAVILVCENCGSDKNVFYVDEGYKTDIYCKFCIDGAQKLYNKHNLTLILGDSSKDPDNANDEALESLRNFNASLKNNFNKDQ